MNHYSTTRILTTIALGIGGTGLLTATDNGDQSQSLRAAPAQVSGARAGYASSMSQPLAAPVVKETPKPQSCIGAMPAAKAGDPSVAVNSVKFVGNERYDDATLGALVEPYLGKKLTFEQIMFLTKAVENQYRCNGYQIVKVVLPQGGLNNGVLTIKVTEGKLGAIEVVGNQGYPDKVIAGVLNSSLEKGKIFRIADAERPLVLLNSYPALSVSSALEPGVAAGTTKMIVQAKEEKMFTGSMEFNNFGSESSGEYRAIPYIAMRNPFGIGDQLSAFAAIAMDELDTWSYQFDYTAPINSKGTGVNFYFGQGNNTAGNEFEILNIQGDSLSWGVGLSHLHVISAKTQLKFNFSFDVQDMTQDMLGMRTMDDSIRKLRLGADFTHSDSRGKTFVSLYIHQGLGELLGGMDNNSTMASRYYADNGFTKIVLSAMRLQRLDEKFYAIFNASGQASCDPLLAAEQIYIGGANSVRGQPYSMAAGDGGYMLNAELRYNAVEGKPEGFNPSLQLAAFFDFGATYTKQPTIGYDHWTSAAGAGVGIRSQLYKGLDLRLDVAAPVGERHGDDAYLYAQLRYSF
ncbi:MAG: ShlB/FhaC/HecB family hemolysin secretion/activation protein [Akkermansia sp.]